MRCHSQALTIKLRRNVPLADIEALIKNDNAWVRWVPNNRAETVKCLTPVAVTGTMDIAVGRVRKLALGEDYLGAYTIGDHSCGARPSRLGACCASCWNSDFLSAGSAPQALPTGNMPHEAPKQSISRGIVTIRLSFCSYMLDAAAISRAAGVQQGTPFLDRVGEKP
jgi:hypothetical protein